MNILQTIENSPLILTECAISERLRRKSDVQLHPLLFNTPLIYDQTGRKRLREIYGEYRETALQAKLPILLCAPTWRVDQARIQTAGFALTLNQDALQFMKGLQNEWQDAHSPFFAGALIGPKNDCYTPAEALTRSEAKAYHSWQIEELSAGRADIIIAQTMPSISEAAGMADALSQTSTPYIISFVINRFGRVLDNTPLSEAIKKLDDSVARPPAGYMVNCVYPTFLQATEQSPKLFERLIGIQANSSSKDHDQLDGSENLLQDPLSDWGDRMLELNRKFGVKILGGCCGTDNSYLHYLATGGKQ